MTDSPNDLEARVTALETVMIDILALAAKEVPGLRVTILRRLEEAAEDFRDLGDNAEAKAIDLIAVSFKADS